MVACQIKTRDVNHITISFHSIKSFINHDLANCVVMTVSDYVTYELVRPKADVSYEFGATDTIVGSSLQ